MAPSIIVQYTLDCLLIVLLLSMPPIVVSALAGLIVSIFQALTQIQEQTLSFGIKLFAVSITIALTAYWLGSKIVVFADNLFSAFPTLGR